MPVYEYVCEKCGAKTEFVESFGSGKIPRRKCGACGSPAIKKAVSGFSYHPEVTLEDLGVKVIRQPASPMPQGGMTGPPPGGCPYCNEGAESDTGAVDGTHKPGPGSSKK